MSQETSKTIQPRNPSPGALPAAGATDNIHVLKRTKWKWMLLSWTCPSVTCNLYQTQTHFSSHTHHSNHLKAQPCPSPPPWHKPAGRKTPAFWICSTPPTHPDFQSDISVSPRGLQLRTNKVDFPPSKWRELKTRWQEKPEGGTPSSSAGNHAQGGAFPQSKATNTSWPWS